MTQIPTQAIQTFKALGDPTRCAILGLLSDGEMTIAEISDEFDMTRAGIKKHLALLQDSQLIRVRPQGRERYNSLNPNGFKTASQWLSYFDSFWDTKLNALKIAAEKDANND